MMKESEKVDKINRKIREYGVQIKMVGDNDFRVRGEIHRSYVFLVGNKGKVGKVEWGPCEEIREREKNTYEWEKRSVEKAIDIIMEIEPEWVER